MLAQGYPLASSDDEPCGLITHRKLVAPLADPPVNKDGVPSYSDVLELGSGADSSRWWEHLRGSDLYLAFHMCAFV
jgi:hypothetical protein